MNKSKKKPWKGPSPENAKTRRYTYDFKLSAVELHLQKGVAQSLVLKRLGMSKAVYWRWLSQYRKLGPKGLERATRSDKGREQMPQAVKDQIVELKRSEPKSGVRRISDILGRMFFMKAILAFLLVTILSSAAAQAQNASVKAYLQQRLDALLAILLTSGSLAVKV